MIKSLLNWFGKGAEDTIKSCPSIQGHVTIQLIDERHRVKKHVEGCNIWTLTGREYLSEIIALKVSSPREGFREDRVAYIGMGVGSTLEIAEVSRLVDPIVYDGGSNFLAPLQTPATHPATASSTTKTSVQFIRQFSSNELNSVNPITEAGLFTDGDPSNNFIVGSAPVTLSGAGTRAPVAYKTFEPISKTSDFTMRIVWEVRFI